MAALSVNSKQSTRPLILGNDEIHQEKKLGNIPRFVFPLSPPCLKVVEGLHDCPDVVYIQTRQVRELLFVEVAILFPDSCDVVTKSDFRDKWNAALYVAEPDWLRASRTDAPPSRDAPM